MPINTTQPFVNYPGATIRGPLDPVDGYVYTRVATAGNVYVMVDNDLHAYGGMG